MQEALEALVQSSRPLVARLAEARELEHQAAEALAQAARVRAELEDALERQRMERLERVKGPRLTARDEFFTVELTGADVRDAVRRFRGGFTIGELAADLGADPKNVKKFLKPMLLSGIVRDSGGRISRQAIFEYVEIAAVPTPARPRRTPPEIATAPAGELRMATGEPVRVRSVDRLTRQQRSGSANVHFHRQRDKRYEEMQAKRAEAAEKAREKADRDMEKLKKMRKKK